MMIDCTICGQPIAVPVGVGPPPLHVAVPGRVTVGVITPDFAEALDHWLTHHAGPPGPHGGGEPLPLTA